MVSKTVAIIAVAMLAVAGVGIYVFTSNNDSGPVADETITDAMGRTVVVPKNIDNGIVTIGWYGALRFVSYFDGMVDKVVGMGTSDADTKRDNASARTYLTAYNYAGINNLLKFNERSMSVETIEKIVNKNPSVVIIIKGLYTQNESLYESLAKKCTVVVINSSETNNMFDSEYKLSKWYTDNIRMLGKIFNKVERGEKHIKDVNALLKDARSYVRESNDLCFLAGATYSGTNALNNTYIKYIPLELAGGKQSYTGTWTQDAGPVNEETFGKLKINKLFIDPQSSPSFKNNESQLVLKNVYSRNNDSDSSNDMKIYSVLPLVSCSANYDMAICGGYYISHILYGTLTKEQLDAKINNVFKVYWGDNSAGILDKMKIHTNNNATTNGIDLPLMTELKVVIEDGVYKTRIAASG